MPIVSLADASPSPLPSRVLRAVVCLADGLDVGRAPEDSLRASLALADAFPGIDPLAPLELARRERLEADEPATPAMPPTVPALRWSCAVGEHVELVPLRWAPGGYPAAVVALDGTERLVEPSGWTPEGDVSCDWSALAAALPAPAAAFEPAPATREPSAGEGRATGDVGPCYGCGGSRCTC